MEHYIIVLVTHTYSCGVEIVYNMTEVWTKHVEELLRLYLAVSQVMDWRRDLSVRTHLKLHLQGQCKLLLNTMALAIKHKPQIHSWLSQISSS